jgi:hypothetical protein
VFIQIATDIDFMSGLLAGGAMSWFYNVQNMQLEQQELQLKFTQARRLTEVEQFMTAQKNVQNDPAAQRLIEQKILQLQELNNGITLRLQAIQQQKQINGQLQQAGSQFLNSGIGSLGSGGAASQ